MVETFRINTNFDEFERIVLLYKDEANNIYIGHSFYYGGRDGSEYLLFLYKEPLPQKDLLAGWNVLDETSIYITIVGVDDHRIAVEDFLVCHNPQLTWEDVLYIPAEDFVEMNQVYQKMDLKVSSAYAFIIGKKQKQRK